MGSSSSWSGEGIGCTALIFAWSIHVAEGNCTYCVGASCCSVCWLGFVVPTTKCCTTQVVEHRRFLQFRFQVVEHRRFLQFRLLISHDYFFLPSKEVSCNFSRQLIGTMSTRLRSCPQRMSRAKYSGQQFYFSHSSLVFS